eukprot:GILI01008858.1.p1 GENE.GILI01008858.1~~GILI01008858.1.p1  ORF type:complete len:178 (-),score=64.37 GILI01008858.1:73-606(-)
MCSTLEDVAKLITEHPDFPKPGINFYDCFPIFRNADAVDIVIDAMVDYIRSSNIRVDGLAGLEARGFIFGPLLAVKLRVPFFPVRKAGKLPGAVVSSSYTKEYGADVIEVHADAFQNGQSILIVDDLLATGGTAAAAISLIQQAGGVVAGCLFLIELKDLNGVSKLGSCPSHALFRY